MPLSLHKNDENYRYRRVILYSYMKRSYDKGVPTQYWPRAGRQHALQSEQSIMLSTASIPLRQVYAFVSNIFGAATSGRFTTTASLAHLANPYDVHFCLLSPPPPRFRIATPAELTFPNTKEIEERSDIFHARRAVELATR